MTNGQNLSPEELQRALADRPKHPLNHAETERTRDVLAWFDEYEKAAEARQARKENRWKRAPVIFASVGGISGFLTGAVALWNWIFPRGH